MTTHIRYMDPRHDIEPILAFLPELYQTNFPGFVVDNGFLIRKRAQLRSAVSDPGQTVLVAVDAQGVCGFIWLVVELEWSGGNRGEVSAVYVAPRARGTGVGRLLMVEGETLLRTYGCKSVHLMVTASNEAAVELYRSLDFHITRYQMEKPLQ